MKCILRKVGHAIIVGGEWVAVARGWLYYNDVDKTKFTCPTDKQVNKTND